MPDALHVEQAVGYDRYRHERARRLIDRVRYKEGYIFRALPDGSVLISTLVPDVRYPKDSKREIQIGWTVGLSDLVPDELCIQSIWRGVLELETHEASEWFKVDGKAIFNEHDLRPEKFR